MSRVDVTHKVGIHWKIWEIENRIEAIWNSRLGKGKLWATLACMTFASIKKLLNRSAVIAKWIRLHLPSCRPGFESQAYHLRFYQFIIVSFGKDENKQKGVGIGSIFFKKTNASVGCQLHILHRKGFSLSRMGHCQPSIVFYCD